jgi:protein tyrosine phosphatase (PTP) superfamily phosphohydrolase (DUF442 family)
LWRVKYGEFHLQRTISPRSAVILVVSTLSPLIVLSCAQHVTHPSAKQQHESVATSMLPEVPVPREDRPAETDYPALQNLLKITENVYSGAEPEGEEAYGELARLGIKTVVSVDGARPDVEAARRHGLRYVHIPIGYDGIDDEAGLSLARLARDGEMPLYIHCHRGRHRGPAAAAIVCIAADETDSEGALNILERSGTSRDYGGLWRDVENYVAPGTDAQLPALVEVVQMRSFAAAMAAIDRSWEKLKLCREVGWVTPRHHADLVPAQVALLLREGFYELERNLSDDYGDEFKALLSGATDSAQGLEDALRAHDVVVAGEHFQSLMKSCKSCHSAYRN